MHLDDPSLPGSAARQSTARPPPSSGWCKSINVQSSTPRTPAPQPAVRCRVSWSHLQADDAQCYTADTAQRLSVIQTMTHRCALAKHIADLITLPFSPPHESPGHEPKSRVRSTKPASPFRNPKPVAPLHRTSWPRLAPHQTQTATGPASC